MTPPARPGPPTQTDPARDPAHEPAPHARARPATLGEDMLPVEPLEERVCAAGGIHHLTAARSASPAVRAAVRSYYRARKNGTLTSAAADAIAVRVLGLHPSLVWGALWWAVSSTEPPEAQDPTETPEPPEAQEPAVPEG